MARVIAYSGQRLRIDARCGRMTYEPCGLAVEMQAVIWDNGEPWLAAMAYVREKAFEVRATGGSPTTVVLHATALASYASFLESEGLDWADFPAERALRPTYRYRGHLIRRVDASTLARSTAANRIGVLRAFYAWAVQWGYLGYAAEPYRPKSITVRYADGIGQQRTAIVLSSDLAIRRPRIGRRGVEEGCLPLRMSDRDGVLAIAANHFRWEFLLVLKLGFFCGLRLGTIVGLTHTALRKHFPSREIPGWFSTSVGPEFGIPTKGGVTYNPSMPQQLLSELLSYCRSARRDTRAAKAVNKNKDLVFVSKDGNPLTTRSLSHDMTDLRTLAKAKGFQLGRFRFHDTRATFGTAFVLASMQAGHRPNQILPVLMRLMGHASAASSMKYIDFVEDDDRMSAAAADWESFLGMKEPPNE